MKSLSMAISLAAVAAAEVTYRFDGKMSLGYDGSWAAGKLNSHTKRSKAISKGKSKTAAKRKSQHKARMAQRRAQ